MPAEKKGVGGGKEGRKEGKKGERERRREKMPVSLTKVLDEAIKFES